MAIKQVRVTIDGVEYSLEQLGAVQGRRFVLRLMSNAAPIIQKLAETDTLNEQALFAALGVGLSNLDSDLVEELSDAFAKKTQVHQGEMWIGLDKLYDQHFAGQYLSMGKWLFESMKLNFADFLGGSSDALASVRAKITASKSPKTPTPTSGESSSASASQTA
jgi:hypothetical protein